MKEITFKIEEEPMNVIVLATNEALETLIDQLVDEKGVSGKVTVNISLEKNTFTDGYKKIRDGIGIKFNVESSITNKSTYSYTIPTDQMMLQESDDFGWHLVPAPDPQQKLEDYL